MDKRTPAGIVGLKRVLAGKPSTTDAVSDARQSTREIQSNNLLPPSELNPFEKKPCVGSSFVIDGARGGGEKTKYPGKGQN